MQWHYPCQDDGIAFGVLDGKEFEVALYAVRIADIQLLSPLLNWKLAQLLGCSNGRIFHCPGKPVQRANWTPARRVLPFLPAGGIGRTRPNQHRGHNHGLAIIFIGTSRFFIGIIGPLSLAPILLAP
jgi:hypothetical protein